MIKIHKNDSIIDIIIKIKHCEEKEIVLDFPFGHPVLHNYTSLKILKTKAEDKELVIVTSDQTAKNIGKQLGIKYTLISSDDLVEYNYSFWEYFRYTIKNYFKEIKDSLLQKTHDVDLLEYKRKYGTVRMGIFVSFLLFSIGLLLFVFYFAVSKTYVYITPEIEIKTKNKNFEFKELAEDQADPNPEVIRLKKIEKTINVSGEFFTTGVNPKDVSPAKGKVVLHNYLQQEIKLKTGTRLKTKDGITYTLDTGAKIPPRTKAEDGELIPGKIFAEVTGVIYDDAGNMLGKKANIKKDIKLTIPGLEDKELQKRIFATSATNFAGGKTSTKRILSEKDIENSKKILQAKIEKRGEDEIKKHIKKLNDEQTTTYEILLGVKNVIQYSDLQFSGYENMKPGDKISKFEGFATMKVSAYVYNKELLLTKMKSSIQSTTLEGIEEIYAIDDKSFTIIQDRNLLYPAKKENPFRAKATVQMDVSIIQNFGNKKNSYVNRLKNKIAGMDKQEAENQLINESKIDHAEVKTRPFFLKNISKFPENIEIEVEEIQ